MDEVEYFRNYQEYVDLQKDFTKMYTNQYMVYAREHDSKSITETFHDRYSLKLLKNINFNRMLDLGCGYSPLTCYLENRKNIVGVDISIVPLKKISHITTVQADAAFLPFKDGTFDLVLNNTSLEFIFYIDKMFEEVKRVMTNDGIFMMSEVRNDMGANMEMIHQFNIEQVEKMLTVQGFAFEKFQGCDKNHFTYVCRKWTPLT